MSEKVITVNEDQLTKLKEYEASISHWSVEHSVLLLKAKKTLEGIDSIYSARQKMVDGILKENEIELKDVKDILFDPSGTIKVIY
jgi:hypothetical protein